MVSRANHRIAGSWVNRKIVENRLGLRLALLPENFDIDTASDLGSLKALLASNPEIPARRTRRMLARLALVAACQQAGVVFIGPPLAAALSSVGSPGTRSGVVLREQQERVVSRLWPGPGNDERARSAGRHRKTESPGGIGARDRQDAAEDKAIAAITLALAEVAPRNGGHGRREPLYDGLERQLDGEIKVRRDQWQQPSMASRR